MNFKIAFISEFQKTFPKMNLKMCYDNEFKKRPC